MQNGTIKTNKELYMKKLIVLILCLGTVGYAYAGKKYEAEIISVDYDGIV